MKKRLLLEKKNGIFCIPLLVFLFLFSFVSAQELDVPYVPTPPVVVEKMLDIVNAGPGDYVIDLGSGDGRIVIAAAKRGAIGHGVDLDSNRITEARENAVKGGVQDKVVFIQENVFETDFSQASVVTMYLLNSVNIKLRKHLLNNLKPGTRVVSHDFDMGDWMPDQFERLESSNIYFWVIPAKAEGQWKWTSADGDDYTLKVEQDFQEIQLLLKSGKTTLFTENGKLYGNRITFSASDPLKGQKLTFSGRIEGDEINGVVHVSDGSSASAERWKAKLR